MTVTYSLDVANSSFFCLYRLLFRWKGSIWKSIWAELLVWLTLYSTLSAIYRLALLPHQRVIFEDLCVFFDTYSSFIPITFMLGFYVSAVFNRWWQIFDNIGWIDTPALWITEYVRGHTERARMMRRTLIRYLVLTQAMVFRDVAAGVRKRFPTMNHLVTAGLMTEKEHDHFNSIITTKAKYWVPMHWVFSLIRVAKEEGKIPGDIVYVDLMEKIRQYRVQILSLTLYDWVPVPLVYTQVVHLAVRSYFAVAVLGRQYLRPAEGRNLSIDSANTVGLNVVDNAYDKFPELERDQFWEDTIPEPLYTAESAQRPINPQIGSCVDMATEDDAYMLRPRRRTISRSSHWDGELGTDDVVPVIGVEKHKENSRSSSSSLEQFGETFHNNVAPPNLHVAHGNSRSVPDGLKISLENTDRQRSPVSPKSNVDWFVDELPVIEEEEQERRRVASEEDRLFNVPEYEETDNSQEKNAKKKEDIEEETSKKPEERVKKLVSDSKRPRVLQLQATCLTFAFAKLGLCYGCMYGLRKIRLCEV
ncbi:bestrophin-1 domain protein [Oesophagostomum dentatum]|uniref:Bestrophin homolog n=1 Tax=Oesophagostomum dentatum TaxID=61180 RepID=A0A0B1T836_OESDE|nr:bestrophin-1 domain protein [Oesophagostomum dentatum]